jgi:hypothetical protein
VNGQLPSCVVLVMSCDAYADLWAPFFNLFWRHWADCPWPVYLGTNQKTFGGDVRVTTVKGGHGTWSSQFRGCLEQIDAEFVLLLLDDYFLDRPVSTPLIFERLGSLSSLNGAMLRLFPMPGPDRKLQSHSEIGLIHPRAQYRVSLQAAIWNREHLHSLVNESESIWAFEWNGTERSRCFENEYYATVEAAVHYRQVLERGEWLRRAARYFREQQIGCDFNARSVMSRSRTFKRAITRTLRKCRSRVITAVRVRR